MVHPVNESTVPAKSESGARAKVHDIARPQAAHFAWLHSAAVSILAIPPDSMADPAEDRIDHGDRERAARPDHAPRLDERRAAIRDVIQARDERHRVEARVRKRQTRGVLDDPRAATPVVDVDADAV